MHTGLLRKKGELQWMLGQWQQGQYVCNKRVEHMGQAWAEWQLEMEGVRVSEARQQQTVEVAELAAQVERYQSTISLEEQRWIDT